MDEVVALLVEVDAFRRDVGGDEHADWRRGHREGLNDPLLLIVTLRVVEGLDLVVAHRQPMPDGRCDPVEGGEALGEDDCSDIGLRPDADRLQNILKGIELGGSIRQCILNTDPESSERLGLGIRGVDRQIAEKSLEVAPGEPMLDCLR